MINLSERIDQYLNNRKRDTKPRNYFYASELGKSKKELFKNLKNPKPFKINAKLHRIFDNGNAVHERFMKYFAEMGVLVAAEIDVSKDDLIHGRCDAIISDREKNYVVEIKSCSQWTFQKLMGPDFAHHLQLQLYMYYLNIPNGIILYECKDNQTVKCFYEELDKVEIETLLEELKKIKEATDEPSNEPLIHNKVIDLKELSYVG